MKQILSFILFIYVNQIVSGQAAPEIEWQKVIGGKWDDYLQEIILTDDGGYVLAGNSRSGIGADKTEDILGDFDYWIVKLDSNRNIEWQNSIRGDESDLLTCMVSTSDGGFLAGGYSNSNITLDKEELSNGGYDYWIVKLDDNGGLAWEKTIGGIFNDYMTSIIQTTDGGYLIGGYSYSGISGDKTEASLGEFDYWVIKLDYDGNIEWQNTIGGNSWDYLRSIQQTTDGGYILGGYSLSDIWGDKSEASIGEKDYWIVKLNSSGAIQWENTIGGSLDDELAMLKPTDDGGFVAVGSSESNKNGHKDEKRKGKFDYWVIKCNFLGNIEWQNTIGSFRNDFAKDIVITTNGFVISGHSDSDAMEDKTESTVGPDQNDFWVVKIDTGGVVIWDNTIGGDKTDLNTSVHFLDDGGYLVGGHSMSRISGDKTLSLKGRMDYWIVKLFPDPTLCDIEAEIDFSGSAIICEGQTIALSVGFNAGYTYQWRLNGSDIVGATDTSFLAESPGAYTVSISNGDCFVYTDEVVVIVNERPIAEVNNLDAFEDLCFDPSIRLKANIGTGYTYQWIKDGVFISGANDIEYFATEAGDYKVKVTNTLDCSKISEPYTIINSCRYGSKNPDLPFIIAPNPASDFVYVQINTDMHSINSTQSVNIQMKNTSGQCVLDRYYEGASQFELELPLSDYENGLYYIELIYGGNLYIEQLIILH